MMPLNYTLRKSIGCYKCHKSQEKYQPSTIHGRHQNVRQNEKELETLIQAVRIYNDDIGMEFGIEKCAMLIKKERKTANDGRNRTSKSRKNQNVRRTVSLQILGNMGSGHHQASGYKTKN